MTTKHLTDQKFSDFDLDPSLQSGLSEAGFTHCTPIQAACLPYALAGRDVAGQAQTGTGKTVAFLLACCHYLLTREADPGRKITQPRAMILAPTRELAIQIHEDARMLAAHTGLKLGLVYGGTGYDTQKKMLEKGVDILIGTPGRVIDYFRQGLFDLKLAEVAVLDEADRMFDLGFIKDIRFLLRRMPPPESRLNLLFSATLSFRVMELAYEHMNDPEEIKIETDRVVADMVAETSYYPADEEKLPLLVNLLKRDDQERILVFVNTRHAAERVSATLKANDISNGALSGDVPQNKRERLLESFKSGKTKVLVATDVAARGLHIPDVSHVYNFDLPQDAEDYVHRIGRTARAGASGEAISFVCEKYAYSLLDIQEFIGHDLPRLDISEDLIEPVAKADPADYERRRDRRGRDRDRSPRKSTRSGSSGGGRGGERDRRRKTAKTDDKAAKPVTAAASETEAPTVVSEADSARERSPDPVTEVRAEGAVGAQEDAATPENARSERSETPPSNQAPADAAPNAAPAEKAPADAAPKAAPAEKAPADAAPDAAPAEKASTDAAPEAAPAEEAPADPVAKAAPAKMKRQGPSKTPSAPTADPEFPVNRFSRRFGEVPAIG